MFSLDPAFVRPTYDGLSFTAIPNSIAGLLGRGTIRLAPEALAGLHGDFRSVVVMLIDGFGWRFFERCAGDYPALRRFLDHGTVTRLTSQFPSTTTAHITCLHTGLEVGQSGLYEWQYYEPQLDAVVVPLLFSFAGTTAPNQLKNTGIDPARLYPSVTLYPGLAQAGITSHLLSHLEYTPSVYSDHVYRGATSVLGCRTLPEALVNLRELLDETATRPAGGRGAQRAAADARRYCVLYFDRFDALCHHYGPGSPQVEAELDALLTTLERLFLARPGRWRADTLFILTADHGEVETDPATTIYLNTDPRFAGIERYLKRNRKGELLAPAGAARDFFLHVHGDRIDEAQAFLAQRLAGRAVVYRTSDLIAGGFFGSRAPAEVFLARVGDLVILPYAGETVWWYEKDRFEMKFLGHHGGLTPQEMEIPLLMTVL